MIISDNDIVMRLRARSGDDYAEAADMIEQLRKTINELLDDLEIIENSTATCIQNLMIIRDRAIEAQD